MTTSTPPVHNSRVTDPRPPGLRALVLMAAAGVAMSACTAGDDDAAGSSACVQDLSLQCTPAYTPTFDAIFSDVLGQSCGASSTGGSCHYGPSASLAKAGLVLSDPTVAYNALLGNDAAARRRVLPNDPHCSILVERLESNDPTFRMPVGSTPLPEATRCAIRQWIANGALR